VITIDRAARGTAEGLIFLAPKKEVAQAGPLILDDAGRVVWFRPLPTHAIADFRAQRYRGRPVLTWWQGRSEKGVGSGRYQILDNSYRTIATVVAGNGLTGDIHEFLITARNTALFTVYRRVDRDLSSVGGPEEGSIQEGVVQEVDIASGRVLFEWHSADRIALEESYAKPPPASRGADADPYDYFHINSVDVDADGDLLISARNTHAIYKVSRTDGSVLWRLGGKRSDFRLPAAGRFAWQHDARRRADGTITLFDNQADPPRRKRSRVLVLRLDEQRMAATVVRSYTHPRGLLSGSQGNAQFLDGGHVFVGWGSNPVFTEFDRSGRVLLDGHWQAGSDSYRAYRSRWTGLPRDVPAIRVTRGHEGSTVSASWNGATEVRRWRVLAGDRPDALRPVATVPRSGFETTIRTGSGTRYVRVEALGRRGGVLGTSRLARPVG
jgi:hypothetical protein